MRIRPALLIGLAFVALGAQAQALPAKERPLDDNPFSIFVYDRLGATPSIQFQRKTRDAVAAPARAPATPRRAGAATRNGGEGEVAVQTDSTVAASAPATVAR